MAGCNLIFSPEMYLAMEKQGVLATGGGCKTFDMSADGYARAEGINAIYIRPLRDAVNNNDPVRAIIRATASTFFLS